MTYKKVIEWRCTWDEHNNRGSIGVKIKGRSKPIIVPNLSGSEFKLLFDMLNHNSSVYFGTKTGKFQARGSNVDALEFAKFSLADGAATWDEEE